MSVQSAPVAKVCCVCGANVSGRQRMRDREGRYWCMTCGEADKKHQSSHGEAVGGLCAVCGDHFPDNQLTRFEGTKFCHACARKRYRQPNMVKRLLSKLRGR